MAGSLSTKQKQTQTKGTHLWLPWGVEEGEGWTANLGLVDASYYIQNGQKNKVIRHSGGLVTKSCPTLAISWTVACQAPLSMGFFRQEYWSGLPFPSPGDLPNPGIKPRSPVLQANSLPTGATREAPDRIIGHCETIAIHLAKAMSTLLNYKLELTKSIATD